MPTGYTEGILSGKISTFQQYAKTCMRAFGATIHMRDNNLDDEYTPREPSDYHVKEIVNAQTKLSYINSATDEKLLQKKKTFIESEVDRLNKMIQKKQENKLKLEAMLEEVTKWTPPTDEHNGLKKFMIEQLAETITWDGDDSYYKTTLESIQEELSNLDASKIREDELAEAKVSLEYHTKEHKKEISNCETSNKWVKDLLSSL